ncbi:MAG: UbiA family prenyltransferase [archaeon]
MGKISAMLELMRLKNCAMAAIGAAIGYLISFPEISLTVLVAMAAVFLVCAGGQAINDVFDAKIDSKISKHKPIPSKRISKREALIFSIFLFAAGIAISCLINPAALLIASGFSLLLILYSALLYRAKYLGNFVVAAGTAFTFIFGAASASNGITPLIILFALSAMFANLARELTKDFEDIKKDKGFKVSLPMKWPIAAKLMALLDYVIAIVFSVFAFALFNLGSIYAALVVAAGVLFCYSASMLFKGKYEKSQRFSKTGMLISLIAYASVVIYSIGGIL